MQKYIIIDPCWLNNETIINAIQNQLFQTRKIKACKTYKFTYTNQQCYAAITQDGDGSYANLNIESGTLCAIPANLAYTENIDKTEPLIITNKIKAKKTLYKILTKKQTK